MSVLGNFGKYFKTHTSLITSSLGIMTERRSSKATLYYDPVSPPARFVLMTAKHLEIQLDLVHVDLFRGDQYSEEFKKTNPLQKVPVYRDGAHVVRDSHAIALYLCERARETSLYPKSPEARADIHQMLFFNSGIMFPIDSAIMGNYFAGIEPFDQKLSESWNKALDFLEYMLGKHEWLSGDSMSLSDLCCAATVSSVGLLEPINPRRHPRLLAWSHQLKELPCYSANEEGLEKLRNKIVECSN